MLSRHKAVGSGRRIKTFICPWTTSVGEPAIVASEASQRDVVLLQESMPKRDDEIKRRVAERAAQFLGRLDDAALARATRRQTCDQVIASKPIELLVVGSTVTKDFPLAQYTSRGRLGPELLARKIPFDDNTPFRKAKDPSKNSKKSMRELIEAYRDENAVYDHPTFKKPYLRRLGPSWDKHETNVGEPNRSMLNDIDPPADGIAPSPPAERL